MDFGTRTLALLPALDVWETAFEREIDFEALEDNEAAIQYRSLRLDGTQA